MELESTKNKIINVAHKLFGRFGFHKTSMDEIAKIARKAKGSLYYHFASKEMLFKEVVSKEMKYLKVQLTPIIVNTDMSASDKMRMYFIRRMEVLNVSINYHETIKADLFEHFEFVDDIRHDLDVWEKSNLHTIIQQGIKQGEFLIKGEIEALLDVLMMSIKSLEIPFFLENKYEKYSNTFDSLLRILTKGIAI
ncbi:MAG: TetR/AcrR family transcriptional regulator [Bacteroidales bacterium]|nr:TetR/AcrR family transcriptional regulator [Bacteroidales bacterium]MCF8389049.1 TetR/AcrR family transcriptional regulator [Bacteroidales bacterium]